MLIGAKDTRHYVEWAEFISDMQVREAFIYFVGLASTLRDYECCLGGTFKGKKDFKFYHVGTTVNPVFSFIVNKAHLLFYFRDPAISSQQYDFDELKRIFAKANGKPNAKNEWHVPLRSVADVQKLWGFISQPTRQPHKS